MHGTRKNLAVSENIYAFAMVQGEDTVIALFNNGEDEEEITLDLSELKLSGKLETLFSGEKITAKNKIEITLEPFGAEMIYNEK